jgi:hypothetical protein
MDHAVPTPDVSGPNPAGRLVTAILNLDLLLDPGGELVDHRPEYAELVAMN